jgi:hypothetical protein
MGKRQEHRSGTQGGRRSVRETGSAARLHWAHLRVFGHLRVLAGVGMFSLLVAGPSGNARSQDTAPAAPLPRSEAPAQRQPQDAPAIEGAAPERGSSRPAQPVDGAGAAGAIQEPAPEQGAAEALSIKYRFQEKYSVNPDPAHPERVTEYQVGVRETFRMAIDQPQGAPQRHDIFRQTIYVEHAARVSPAGDLLGVVRRYDKFYFKSSEENRPPKLPSFQGLTVLAEARSDRSFPQILSLTEGRPVRELEYNVMQTQVSFHALRGLIPAIPRRIGETWRIPPRQAFALVGEMPDQENYDLNATLATVRRADAGTRLNAVFAISGQAQISENPVKLNAEMEFTFDPQPAEPPPAGAGEAPDALEKGASREPAQAKSAIQNAPGRITQLRMGKEVSIPLPEGDGRLRQTTTYQLVLARRPLDAAGGQAAVAPVQVPDPLPAATEANSWLVYIDPSDRFYFRRPQDLAPPPAGQRDPDEIEYFHEHPRTGRDILIISLPPKESDPERGLSFQDPEHFRSQIKRRWTEKKVELLSGPSGWLPEAEWAPSKRKVYRVETGLKSPPEAGGNEGRLIIDYYLVDFGRGRSIQVQSWTNRENHLDFRQQAEDAIKSFEFGPWPGQAPARENAPPVEPPVRPTP